MSKFKIGDKVRLKLFITYDDLTKDSELTVKEVFPESGMMSVEENDYLHSMDVFRHYPKREINNQIAAGTWLEFLKDYQGAKAQDQCKVLSNIQGGLYVTNQRGGQIYSLEPLKSRGILEIMSDYDTDVATLAWQHNRSALVHLMLLDGYKYIMCEVAEGDKQYFKDETPRFIVESMDDGGFFIDVRGNMWQSAQPINNDGTEMTYDDYIELKQL